MFYFRSSLFKGGAKNDAKLKTNFETCKFFRRFFKLFFRRPAQKKHPGAQLPSLCPQPRLHLPAPSRPLRRDLRPKSECKVRHFPRILQIFRQEIYAQKHVFTAYPAPFTEFQPLQRMLKFYLHKTSPRSYTATGAFLYRNAPADIKIHIIVTALYFIRNMAD